MAHLTERTAAGFVDPKTNNFPGSMAAYCSDGASIVIGSLMGTSPVTVFVGALQTVSQLPHWLVRSHVSTLSYVRHNAEN